MRTVLIVPLLGAAVLAIAVLDPDSGVFGWWQLRAELAQARERIDKLSSATAELQIEVKALESDSFALERAIREDLELARPGETVVRLRPQRRGIAGRQRADLATEI